jgi:predicted pyridoxine 5'-phosphate oxidase superfamily flavin-nucleotide-binding protein
VIHEGENTVQRRAGISVIGRGSAGVGAAIPPVAAEFLHQQRMLLLGAVDRAGAVWASVLTGPPNFATVRDERTITVTAGLPAGDPLADRFEAEHDIGLLAIDLSNRKRMRINGRARRDGDHLLVHTEQVLSNCPKYIQTRTLLGETANQPGLPVVTHDLSVEQRRWIAAADTFFIATHAAGLGADVSHRGGNPGFVTATGRRDLSWPDYVGNSMFMTLGNLELDPRCGLLFLDWDSGHTLQLTGRARVDWDPRHAASVPGAQRLVDLHVERVVEIPRANPQRWSLETYFRFNPG